MFLDGAGVKLTDTKLTIGDQSWEEGKDKCDGKDAELVVAQWNNVETTKEKPALIRRDFNDIRFRQNGEGYTIAFVPEGTTDIPKPESAANLAELGAADATGAQPTDTGSTAPVDPNATDTTVATDPNATATTAPADTTATTAPGG